MNNNLDFLTVKRVRNFPVIFSLFFLIVSLIMFAISPWEWVVNNKLYFYILNLLYIFGLFFGYILGISKYKIRSRTAIFSLYKFLNISLYLNLFLIYPKFLFRLKVPSLSISDFFTNIAVGISDPALAYATKHLSEFNDFLTLSNPITLIYFISLPLQYLAIPLGVFYWKQLSISKKVIFLLIVISDILSYVMIGTNKGIFDYIILLPVILMVKNPDYLSLRSFLKTRNLKYFLILFLILSLGIGYFVEGNKGRKNDNFGYDFSTMKFVNRDSFILQILPGFLEDSYIALDSYLTSGYYAMGLALEIDHKFTYGAGHNAFFISLGEKVLGTDAIQNISYQKRIEQEFGLSSTTKWHTFYVWMANDLSFLGVAVFLFFFGYFFAQIWLDALNFFNPFAIILLPLFFTVILYLTANNQVLGNQGGSFIFWTYFIFWYRSRGRFFYFK